MPEALPFVYAGIESIVLVGVSNIYSLKLKALIPVQVNSTFAKQQIAYLASGSHITGDSNIDWKPGFEWAGPRITLVLAEIICFEIEYP